MGGQFLVGPFFEGPNRGYQKKIKIISPSFSQHIDRKSKKILLSCLAVRDAKKVQVNLTPPWLIGLSN